MQKLTDIELRSGYRVCTDKIEKAGKSYGGSSHTVHDAYRAYFRRLVKQKRIVAIGYNTVNGCASGGRFVIGTLARTEDYSDRVVVINRNGQAEEVRFHDIDRVYLEGTFTPEWRKYGGREY